jgi:flagellar biosynthesis protein FlhG
VRSVDEIKLGFSIKSVCHKYFGIDVDYLGYVNHDEAVRKSVMARRPLVTLSPANDAAVYVDRIARKLLGPAAPVGARPGGSLA